MASRANTELARPGDMLVVVHEFQARSPDELSLARGERIELIERDDDFGDGWFLGRNVHNGESGLFPEVYTRPAPRPTLSTPLPRPPPLPSADPLAVPQPPSTGETAAQISESQNVHPPMSAELPANEPPVLESAPSTIQHTTSPLQISSVNPNIPAGGHRTSLPSGVAPRSLSMALSGTLEEHQGSPVMNETLSVIDEHITDMSTPRHSVTAKDLRVGNDSGSEYSSHHRLSYINGNETEEEEQNQHTESEVSGWTPARVAEYLEDAGVEKRHCDVFREQEINGEALLGMDQATIFLKEFELGPVGPRLRTWLKIKALQHEVKNAKNALKHIPSLDGGSEASMDSARNRSTSMGAIHHRMPSASSSMTPPTRQILPRSNSAMGRSPNAAVEAPSPLATPTSMGPGSPSRPSAASIRSLNHNRRHSSIDYSVNPSPPIGPSHGKSPSLTQAALTHAAQIQASHKKTPSFDRNWTMGSPQKPSPDLKRPSSSNHMHSLSSGNNAFDSARDFGMTTASPTDLDRGYFSGGEVDNRKGRNVLRKKDSPSHSRNASYSSESSRRIAYNRRHSRIGSADSIPESGSPVSPAARQYYGSSIRGLRTSSAFDFIRPLKPASEMSPTVTKLDYAKTPSIDAIAASSPNLPSENSSTGRASPSPAIIQSHSFFGKKSRSGGLRAISDAITGNEKAQVSGNNSSANPSPVKESPLHSPTHTGSSTPSANSKSLELENGEMTKRSTVSSTASAGRKKSKKQTSAYLRGREVITPQEAMIGCDYSGWMKKKTSNLMTTWKTRLFVLRGRRLSYFYTEYDTEEKGLIDISSHRVLPANDERITGFHATITRASSSPSSPQNATIPTTASTEAANAGPAMGDASGMFIFKLVPPRSGLQKGVQFTKPVVYYFAVDNIQQGRLWMAALMKATIDRDDTLPTSTTYQQKTITLEKARALRTRPPALMDDPDDEKKSDDENSKKSSKQSKTESIRESVIQEEDEKQGLAIAGLDDAKALLDYAENGEESKPATPAESKTDSANPLTNGEDKEIAA